MGLARWHNACDAARPMYRFLLLPILLPFALFVPSLRSAPPLRLYEIGAARFIERNSGEIWLQRGLFSALGKFVVSDESPVLSVVTVPTEARNRTLIQLEAWYAYSRLGAEAVSNFVINEDDIPYTIGLRQYIVVEPHPEAKLSDGKLINISTRGRASVNDKLVGGFVIEERPRWVLIRAVGPGLAQFGVDGVMSDPYLTLYKSRTPIYYNGDWNNRPDAGEVAKAAIKAGAFALAEGSKDAALLVQLQPGAYTAQVEPESGAAGQVLIEVYSVPESS